MIWNALCFCFLLEDFATATTWIGTDICIKSNNNKHTYRSLLFFLNPDKLPL